MISFLFVCKRVCIYISSNFFLFACITLLMWTKILLQTYSKLIHTHTHTPPQRLHCVLFGMRSRCFNQIISSFVNEYSFLHVLVPIFHIRACEDRNIFEFVNARVHWKRSYYRYVWHGFSFILPLFFFLALHICALYICTCTRMYRAIAHRCSSMHAKYGKKKKKNKRHHEWWGKF